MPLLTSVSPRSILDDLQQSLDHALTTLSQKWTNVPLSLKPVDVRTAEPERRSFQLEGPNDVFLEVHFAVFPLGDDTFEVQVEVDDGPIRCFTYNVAPRNAPSDRTELGRKVSSFLLHEIEPQLGQHPASPSANGSPSHVPQIELDRDGNIQHLNDAARAVLEYTQEEPIDRNFFTHVDGHNLRRVMRDLAQMISHGMQRARWLLRLNTGNDRWRWYKAAVRNELRSAGAIRIHLRPLGTP